jgi:RNA polymerase primary sigma factor
MTSRKPIDSAYLNAIGRAPLLTETEELELGRIIQAGAHPDATDHQVRRAVRAKNRMITANMRLAVALAVKALPRTRSMEFQDLVQEACFGLNRAAEKFDPTRGYKFSTYAYRWVQQSLTRAIANQDAYVRIPIHTREMLFRFAQVTEDAIKQGKPLSIQETCVRAKVAPHLFQAATAVTGVASLDYHRDDNETELVDLVEAQGNEPSYFDEIGVEPEQLLQLVRSLPPQQAAIVQATFGLDGVEEVTQVEIGLREGITRQAACDSKRKAIRRLRRQLAAQGVSP